jgi:hypothetical protein
MLENVEAIEAKKPAKLFVATPMYGGLLCVGGYTMGILSVCRRYEAWDSDVLLVHDE